MPTLTPAKPETAAHLAATMLLIREGAGGMEIFMVVRHHEIDFASGALVFPGVRVDPGDHDIAARPEMFSDHGSLDTAALALGIAAVRETFEECGILLARPRGSDRLVTAERLRSIDQSRRAELCAGEVSFAGVIESEQLVLALDLLVPFAHWITPERMPKRYDTHFFLAIAPVDQIGVHDGKEAVDSVWISPQRALDESKAGRFKILFPTERNLVKLAHYQGAHAALEQARAARVITVTPELVTSANGQRQLRIPKDAGYDGEVFDIDF